MDDRHYLTVVDSEDAGMRLDSFLATISLIKSRSQGAKLIEEGKVLLNDTCVKSKKHLVEEGDQVLVELPKNTSAVIVPDFIPLDIRHEDEYLIVLSKQAGLVVHPSPGHERGTLANALVAHVGAEHLGLRQGDDRPGIVHRLDKDTSGLMLAAKDDETQAALQNAIKLRTVDRRYLALVQGMIAPETGIIDGPIARSGKDRMKMVVSNEPHARDALTTFTVLERFDAMKKDSGFTLLECKLYTGRTHQIRVHMAYIHHPCVGDPLYSSKRNSAHLGLTRQFLHSYRISFEHPITHQQLSYLDVLPWDLQAALDDLQERSLGKTELGEKISQELEMERAW
ncbi:MAG: RluA family pseudouridine synthase [Coriobacteriia bacterium]|nr:RluA family pseudouridine synthase [Coriobacteriia bacterium]